MKSIHFILVFSFFSSITWAGSCGRGGSCGNNQPLFQSPFSNLQGSSSVGRFDSSGLSSSGLDTISSLGGGGDSFGNNSFNGLTFDSRGARIRCRGGFLEVAGQPIFIGDNGEILVKDPVTGQLVPADSNTTNQVLNHYQDWAQKVANGQLPNDSRFAIAQRALSGASVGNFAGGFSSPFAGNQNSFGGTPSNPNFQRPQDPSIPPPGAAQNQPPTTPATPPTPPGSHAGESVDPGRTERPVEPPSAQEQNLQASIDKTKFRVFSDGKGHHFFLNNDVLTGKSFSSNSKIANEMNITGVSQQGSGLDISFEDSRFANAKASIAQDKLKLTCGDQNAEFQEVKGDEAQKALEKVEFKPLPEIRETHFLAKTTSGEIIYVSRNKFSPSPETDRLFVGEPGKLLEIKITRSSVLRDGGSTIYEAERGIFRFPIREKPSFAPKQEGEPDIPMELVDPAKLKPEDLEAMIGKALFAEMAPKTLHTLCDQFEKP